MDVVIERLTRIETAFEATRAEIASMRDAIVRLVRIEEHQGSIRAEVTRVGEMQDKLEEQLDTIQSRLVALEQARAVGVWVAGIAATVLASGATFLVTQVMAGG